MRVENNNSYLFLCAKNLNIISKPQETYVTLTTKPVIMVFFVEIEIYT